MKGRIKILISVLVDTGDKTPREAIVDEIAGSPPFIELTHESLEFQDIKVEKVG